MYEGGTKAASEVSGVREPLPLQLDLMRSNEGSQLWIFPRAIAGYVTTPIRNFIDYFFHLKNINSVSIIVISSPSASTCASGEFQMEHMVERT